MSLREKLRQRKKVLMPLSIILVFSIGFVSAAIIFQDRESSMSFTLSGGDVWFVVGDSPPEALTIVLSDLNPLDATHGKILTIFGPCSLTQQEYIGHIFKVVHGYSLNVTLTFTIQDATDLTEESSVWFAINGYYPDELRQGFMNWDNNGLGEVKAVMGSSRFEATVPNLELMPGEYLGFDRIVVNPDDTMTSSDTLSYSWGITFSEPGT